MSDRELLNGEYADGALVNQTVIQSDATINNMSYFEERYQGKVCCLCNLGERSSLGQGDLIIVKTTTEKLLQNTTENAFSIMVYESDCRKKVKSKNPSYQKSMACKLATNDESCDNAEIRKLKGSIKSRITNTTSRIESVNELDLVGHLEAPPITTLIDPFGYFYIHKKCIIWSHEEDLCDLRYSNILQSSIIDFLQRKCNYCNRFGASIICHMSCSMSFHLPCAVATGCFLSADNQIALCLDHLQHASYLCKTPDWNIYAIYLSE